ncbi:MAG: VWA domain-containing protein [Clostridiales bacterium]|nr:VWA domain-containing protein [Clostridiales bacterium]
MYRIKWMSIALAFSLVFSGCSGGSKTAEAPEPVNAAGATKAASEVEEAPAAAYAPEGTQAPGAVVPEREYPETGGKMETGSLLPDAAQKAAYYVDDNGRSFSVEEEYSGVIPNMEGYIPITENQWNTALGNPVMTFSLKVDSASYRNAARYLNSGILPPRDAVRIEEFINYFNYDTPLPETDSPFSIYTEIGPSIFGSGKRLAFVRVKSKSIDRSNLPKSNLTFLIDTSGSMDSYDKLPLLKTAFQMLVDTLTDDDVVSIATYAGSSSILLDSVPGGQGRRIMDAIQNLEASGSTAGADGINTAYELAEKNFLQNGNNRVILATDGDFNVGVSSLEELKALISAKRKTGVYLSVLGFGTGNLKDNVMETLAKNGNGNYGYIDNVSAAKKILVDELNTSLYAIAEDVKAQIEFNPALVESYKLIGYENSIIPNQDFDNDAKDAGEIGVGTDVVLMFEVQLKEGSSDEQGVLKYQAATPTEQEDGDYSDELLEVRIRYKNPGESESKLIANPVSINAITDRNSTDFNFASAVAGFGSILAGSNDVSIEDVQRLAIDSMGEDKGGYRKEFADLTNKYKAIR